MNEDLRIAELSAQVSKSVVSEKAIKNSINTVNTNTIVIAINKKNAIDVFDFLNEGTIGKILRSSTLAAAYTDKSIRDPWIELNKDDTSSFTNILYIPKVMIFIDGETNEIRKSPYYINVLVVALPSVKKMSTDGVEEVSDEDACARAIADIAEASIKCGCKDIVFNPYKYKLFTKDPRFTAELWYMMTSSQRFIENIKSINFALESEEEFITFNAARIDNTK